MSSHNVHLFRRPRVGDVCYCRGAEALGADPVWFLHEFHRGQGQTKVRSGGRTLSFPSTCCLHDSLFVPAADRLVQEAMSGEYLNSSFSLPCPPGLRIPPEVISPFTSNNLKVNWPPEGPSVLCYLQTSYTAQCCLFLSLTNPFSSHDQFTDIDIVV